MNLAFLRSHFLLLGAFCLAMAGLGCSSDPPPKKKKEPPKKHAGIMCKNVLEPKRDELKKALSEKDFEKAQKIFALISKKGKEMDKDYVPKMDKKNLDAFHDEAQRLSEVSGKGEKAAQEKALDKAQGALQGINQRCEFCHLATRL